MTDILVVGAGLAGSIAALCAQRQGAKVTVASRGHGATALSSGALEIAFAPALAAAKGPGASLAEHLQAVVHDSPRHPYALFGAELTQQHVTGGYAALAEALAGSGLDIADGLGWTQPNAPSISALGCLVPVAMPLGPHRGFLPAAPQGFGLIHLPELTHFAAERVAAGVALDAQCMGLPASLLRPVSVDMPPTLRGRGSPFALACALDSPQHCTELGVAIRQALGSWRPAGLIVPPVIGLARFAQARRWLAEAVGLPIIEALSHLPSVPGLRLQRTLTTALERAGVTLVGEVVSFEGENARLRCAVLADGSRLACKAVVLATGRFVGGGIHWRDETAREALLGLPLLTCLGPLEAQSPQAVLRATPAEAHPLMTAGIGINRACQPLIETELAWSNLFAAGMVLGGFSARYQLCADGIALASAHRAAQAAVQATSDTPLRFTGQLTASDHVPSNTQQPLSQSTSP